MKKYMFLGLISLFLFINNKPSYAYENCADVIDEPSTVNTNNLVNYINSNYSDIVINYICSNNECYNIKNESLDVALENFLIIIRKNTSDELKYEMDIKGYPITKISLNQCE